MSPYSFNVETRRFESRMKADGEVVEEARLSENIPCDIPTEAGCYLNYVCSVKI